MRAGKLFPAFVAPCKPQCPGLEIKVEEVTAEKGISPVRAFIAPGGTVPHLPLCFPVWSRLEAM